MATKVDDKEPDTDNGGGGGGGEERDVFISFGTSSGLMQLQVQRLDAGGATVGLWALILLPESKEMRQVVDYVKEHGMCMADETVAAVRSQFKTVGEQIDQHGLRTGSLLPCECCGAATRGMLASGLEPSFPWLRQPDDAGRIWLVEEDSEDPLIAVCSNPDCVDAWLAWQDACGEEVGRLARRGPGGRS